MIEIKKIIITVIIVVYILIGLLYVFNEDENFDVMVVSKNSIDYLTVINNLKEEYNNEDIVGILEIESSEFYTPIVQTIDNEFYLNHTINKEKSIEGSIFLDYRVNIENSRKLLIYGHSNKNRDYFFNILENYYDEEYFNNNKYIKLITSSGERVYEIFSVFVEVSDFSYMNIDYIDEEYLNHINNLKHKSIYETNVEINKEDEILILQTCSTSNEYKDYKNKYLLIVSRRIVK